MRKYLYIMVIILISLAGIYFRVSAGAMAHPDGDDMFEYTTMQNYRNFWPAVISNKSCYGDHSSYPGEYILHFNILKKLGLFKNTDNTTSRQFTKRDCLILIIPHALFMLAGFILLYFLCETFISTATGKIIAFILFSFNSTLIYHALGFRPYAVLPTLAMANLYFLYLFLKNKNILTYLFYILTIFFTCIYHAYGILLVGFPIIFCCGLVKIAKTDTTKTFITFIKFLGIPLILSVLAWAYYASYNTFGMTPNAMQSKVDPFQFIPQKILFQTTVTFLFGNGILTMIFFPVVVVASFMSKRFSDFLFVFLFVLSPLLLIFAIDIKSSYWILQRQYIWVMPFFAIFTGMMIDRLRRILC